MCDLTRPHKDSGAQESVRTSVLHKFCGKKCFIFLLTCIFLHSRTQTWIPEGTNSQAGSVVRISLLLKALRQGVTVRNVLFKMRVSSSREGPGPHWPASLGQPHLSLDHPLNLQVTGRNESGLRRNPFSPGWCGSVGCELKGLQLDSQSEYLPAL